MLKYFKIFFKLIFSYPSYILQTISLQSPILIIFNTNKQLKSIVHNIPKRLVKQIRFQQIFHIDTQSIGILVNNIATKISHYTNNEKIKEFPAINEKKVPNSK